MRLSFQFIILGCLLISSQNISAQAGDTTIVQTFSWDAQNDPNTAYESPGRKWFQFPASNNGVEYQKILMYYNLKCFSQGTAGNLGYPCGEWDYLTYTYLYDHTGVMDSTLGEHPHFLVNNQGFDQALLTSTPVQITREYSRDAVVIDTEANISITEIGQNQVSIAGPFTSSISQKSVYLYRAAELIDAGFQGGMNIGKIGLNFEGVPSDIHFLKMEFALTLDTAVTGFYSTGNFTTAYNLDTHINADGWQDFNTFGDFVWDGTSNLLIRISHTNYSASNTSLCAGEEKEYYCSYISAGNDKYMKFDWQDEVKVPAEVFQDVSTEISISFWQFGDAAIQPQDGTIFEGVNSQNQRVLNAHLPWSNSNVYWDAGYDGGYDRINKLANATNFEGKWNHWCFTKNATNGEMKIFLNGVLWHSGTNLDNLMLDVQRFSIGGATSWSNFYNGSIDEFAVFNVALDAATIQAWMSQDITSAHPLWNNLQVYYQFNENDGESVLDASGHDRHAWMHGNAARIAYTGNELWRNGGKDYFRPQIRLTSGDFTTHTEPVIGSWVQTVPPVSIVEYDIQNYQPVSINVSYDWVEQMSFTITSTGDTINEVLIPHEYVLNNDTLEYWQAPFEIVDRYELNRFITMYGINLTLGTDGWTWIVDMTDWEPLLRDSVELEAGNWQELLDMKFVFIEGPSPRDVKRVQRVWDTNQSLSNFDNVVDEKIIEKQPGETMWKLVTTNTGHQFDNPPNCAEFCSNIQEVKVNGQQQWSWDIMQECSLNPLYPQGGTWLFDRAGWCPGMNSATKEFELTPLVGNGNDFSVDYNIQYNDYGNYVFFGTLFGYGSPNQQHDPEIEMITAPSDWKIHKRWNPICDNPKFILRNRGGQPLTDLNIIFGVSGGTPQAYHWTGNLAFMESEEIELTCTDPVLWVGDDVEQKTFYIQLGFSADGVDENTSNNYAESKFHSPPTYQYTNLDDNRVIIILKTNLANTETSYVLYDINGNVVYQRSDFPEPSTIYRDTIQLNTGCYLFHLKDSDDDGLDFFANDDGSGYCKLDRVQGADFINLQRDFGREIQHYFYFSTDLVSVQELKQSENTLRIFPNPAKDTFKIETTGFDRNLEVQIFDAQGRIVRQEKIQRRSALETPEIDIHAIDAGLYTLRISDGVHFIGKKLIKE